MKLEFCEQIFEKYSNIKFHENPSGGSRVVPCGQMEGWTDVMKLIVTFCNFANASKNSNCFPNKIQSVLHLHQFLNVNCIFLCCYQCFSRTLLHYFGLLHTDRQTFTPHSCIWFSTSRIGILYGNLAVGRQVHVFSFAWQCHWKCGLEL